MAEQVLKTIIQVRRDTTANWVRNKDVIPAAGEPCLDTDKGTVKYGDGVTTYENLKESGVCASHYEGVKGDGESDNDVIMRVISDGGITPSKDDIFVVKSLIANEKFSYTAFVYDGSVWAAMDGNYNAENVYFGDDLITTTAIGNISLENGQATISASGKNLKEVFNTIFVEEQNPETTQPSVGVTFTEAKAYEVGTSVTPTYTATFNKGQYSYKPVDTGVTVTSWEISDTAGNTASTSSGSFPAITVDDNTNYKITAKANHSEGAVPETNLGNPYESGKIAAGSKSKVSGAITGYRNSFYGTVTDKTATVDSAAIRGLSAKSGKSLANGAKFSVSVPVNAQRVIIAYPATLRDVSSIQDVNGMNAEIKSGFSQSVVSVEGANGASAIDYKVYILDFANPNDTANTYAVTI